MTAKVRTRGKGPKKQAKRKNRFPYRKEVWYTELNKARKFFTKYGFSLLLKKCLKWKSKGRRRLFADEVNRFIGSGMNYSVYRLTTDKRLLLALSPFRGMTGVFLDFNNREIKSTEYITIDGMKFLSVKGEKIVQIFPAEYVPGGYTARKAPDRERLFNALLKAEKYAGKGKDVGIKIMVNGRVKDTLHVSKKGDFLNQSDRKSNYVKNSLDFAKVYLSFRKIW